VRMRGSIFFSTGGPRKEIGALQRKKELRTLHTHTHTLTKNEPMQTNQKNPQKSKINIIVPHPPPIPNSPRKMAIEKYSSQRARLARTMQKS